MVPYLTLSDDEWTLIQKILPTPKRGPKRPHDRAVCAALLFCRAADCSVESLPVGQFPDAIFLRSTQQRWLRDGTLTRLFQVGAKAEKRMARQYEDEIQRLTWERVAVSGLATETLPRWTHVRQR
jgi:transposase